MQARDLAPGMKIDLEGDPHLTNLSEDDQIPTRFEYAVVEAVDHEPGDVVGVWFENMAFGVGWPADHGVEVVPD